MTSTQMLIASLWVGTGLFSALLMGRRGHRHWYWTVVALLLGPLAWPVLAERRSGETPHVQQMSAGQVAPGLHLLAGIDGSEDSAHAATAAAHLLRASVGRVTLATVVDYDTESIGVDELDDLACSRLRPVASRLPGRDPAEAVLVGPPVKALLEFAAEHAVDVIVVGPKGHRLSQRLLGSVTSELVSQSPIPVLVIGGRPPRR